MDEPWLQAENDKASHMVIALRFTLICTHGLATVPFEFAVDELQRANPFLS